MSKNLLDYLLPKNKYGDNLNCYFDINEVANSVIKIKKIDNFTVFYLFSYQDPWVKEMFVDIKLKSNYSIIPDLYKVFEAQLLTKVINNSTDLLIGVPTDSKRYIKRGFGLIEEMLILSTQSGYNVDNLFYKKLSTINRSKLNKTQRMLITNNYDFVDLDKLKCLNNCQQLFIFDDVITTGSTFLECAYKLQKNVGESIPIFGVMIAG